MHKRPLAEHVGVEITGVQMASLEGEALDALKQAGISITLCRGAQQAQGYQVHEQCML